MKEGIDKLKKLIKTLKEVPKEVAVVADLSMVVNSDELVEMNREQLREDGEDGEGKPLQYKHKRVSKVGVAYTVNYERFKRKKGGVTNKVNLSLSGQYLKTLQLDHARKGVFRINSTGEALLQRELEWNYGKDIHGINTENISKFAKEHIEPDVNQRVQQLLDRI